jgi:NADP-dependent 3-hydroxy acid dehydrogenase YdfG
MKRDLRDMVVVITGASAGIGRALAENLAARGAHLVLCARRLDRLQELAGSLTGNHLAVRADVSRQEDCESVIAQAARHFGRIDTLVCNAGYGIARSIVDSTHDDVTRMFETNVYGTLDCIRAAVPVMQNQPLRNNYRGQVMIVSSAAARRGLPYFGIYSATKFAQLGIAEALRVELKPVRIAVTSVHPVGTDTEFFSVAEEKGGLKMPPRGTGEVRQSPATVARKMTAAIQRPRPELWPVAPARIGLTLATLFPGLVDRVMARYRGDFAKPAPGTQG